MSTTAIATIQEIPLRIGTWQVDETHSSILFSIRHLGLAKVRGRFERFETTLEIGPTLAESTITATIDLESINTNNNDRDTHLRSTDFFSTASHPTAHFRATGIQGAGSDWVMRGELTLNGITRPISLDVEFNGLQEMPQYGHVLAGFTATGVLRRSEFGIDFGMLPLGADKLALSDEVKLELDVEYREPAS